MEKVASSTLIVNSGRPRMPALVGLASFSQFPLPSCATMPRRARHGEEAALATEVMAPMVGKVLRLAAKVGDHVNEDDPVVVIEAMKMEIEVVAPAGGTISEIKVAPGDTVNPDTVL